MTNYAKRLAWAMACAGYDPARDQSRLAKAVGKPCQPQNIQHLLNQDNEVRHSKYTLDLAMILGCSPFWLEKGIGAAPVMPDLGKKYPDRIENIALMAANANLPAYYWPFTTLTEEQWTALEPQQRKTIEDVALGFVQVGETTSKRTTPAPNRASA